MISKKQEQDEKNSSLAESNVFFFQISIFKKSEKKEGGEGERERERVVVVVGRKAQSHIYTHTHRERERMRGVMCAYFMTRISLD